MILGGRGWTETSRSERERERAGGSEGLRDSLYVCVCMGGGGWVGGGRTVRVCPACVDAGEEEGSVD